MRVKFYLVLILVTCCYLTSKAQSAQKGDVFAQLQESTYHQGEVTFEQDENLKNFVLLHIQKSKSHTIPGYRVNIFRDSGRNSRQDAQNIKANFNAKFPDVTAYLEYDSPFWKVYVGDFRTKSEALKNITEIKAYFPNAFIINDKINLPDLD